MHCTQCGTEGQGRFCATCGAPLEAIECRSCGSEIPAGTRFCNSCGTPASGRSPASDPPPGARGRGTAAAAGVSAAGGAGSPSSGRQGEAAGWWVAGGLFALLLVVGAFVVFGGPEETTAGATPNAPFAGAPSAGSSGAPPDLSSMSPREAADRLFNRVMQAAANDNTAEADQFLPMALDAYELARPLNNDGLFHLSLLQRANGNLEGSLASAREGLESNPDHLLNLYSAAEASIRLGDAAAGREYYDRLLAAWDDELAAERQEYDEHAPLLPTIREEAEAFLPGGDEP